MELIDEVAELIEKEISDDDVGNESGGGSGEFPVPKETEGNGSSYAVFSDGACRGNPGPGAWGAMAQNAAGEVLLRPGVRLLTNNQMELEGAYQGLYQLCDRRL